MHLAVQHPCGLCGVVSWCSDLQAASPAFHLLLLQQSEALIIMAAKYKEAAPFVAAC